MENPFELHLQRRGLFSSDVAACDTGRPRAQARTSEIDATARFGPVQHEAIAWTGRHTPAQLRALFASYSPCLALPPADRIRVLDAIEQLADDAFAGVVERPYLTLVYLAQRRT